MDLLQEVLSYFRQEIPVVGNTEEIELQERSTGSLEPLKGLSDSEKGQSVQQRADYSDSPADRDLTICAIAPELLSASSLADDRPPHRASSGNSCRWFSPVLLVVDDLEVVMSLFMGEGEGGLSGTGADREGGGVAGGPSAVEVRRRFAHSLSRLLHVLSDPKQLNGATWSAVRENQSTAGGTGRDAPAAATDINVQQDSDSHTASAVLPIVVVGAVRLASLNQLPRAHMGAPEFDRTVLLPSPSVEERCWMLEQMLAQVDYPLQAPGMHSADGSPLAVPTYGAHVPMLSEDCLKGCSSPSPIPPTLPPPSSSSSSSADVSMLSEWAQRLAALTAGYLPGDLKAVVNRIVLLHNGKLSARAVNRATPALSGPVPVTATSSAASGSTSSDAEGRTSGSLSLREEVAPVASSSDLIHSSSDSTINWGTCLEALLSVAPKQLQRFDSQPLTIAVHDQEKAGGAHGGIRYRRLCWDDFAGYPAVKTYLKVRLNPTQFMANTARAVSGSSSLNALDSGENILHGKAGISALSAVRESGMSGIVLHGPSGCGKSLLARIIAAEVT